MSKEIQEYWRTDSTFQDKKELFNNQRSWSDYDDWNEEKWEDDDDWDFEEDEDEIDEHSHTPNNNRYKHTHCIYCGIALVKTHINGKTVYVDPKELEKLEQWKAMSTQHGQDDRLTINSNLSSTGESEEA